ncbi:unnamed protein product [Penicillium manginii]
MSSEAQNIYDLPEFFSAYSTLPRSQGGLSSAPEWPVLRRMVLQGSTQQLNSDEKELDGKKVLDLGCGYGWFSRWARESGASHIRGVDLSEKMINRAKEFDDAAENRLCEIVFETGDLDKITFRDSSEEGRYDLVYSSLTFHYVEDLSRLYRETFASLKQGDWTSVQEGGQEKKVWPLNSYSEEGWRYTSWLGVSGVKKYHRTVETYVTLLLENGFKLTGLKDWVPSKEAVSEHPEWADERHRPYFLLISAEKR